MGTGTVNTDPRQVSVDSSAIPQMLALMGGSQSNSKQTTSMDTSALKQVLAQLQAQGGANQNALMATLMQQFAGKIPAVQVAQNATGGRTPTGMMTGQMQKILSDATVAAQAQIAQQTQQNLQTQAAVADSVAKGSATTQTKVSGGKGPMQAMSQVNALNGLIAKATGVSPLDVVGKKLKGVLGFDGADSAAAVPGFGTDTFSFAMPTGAIGFGGGLSPSFSLPDVGTSSAFSGMLNQASLTDALPQFAELPDISNLASSLSDLGNTAGSFSAGDAVAGAASPTDLSGGATNLAPFLSAANYLANPKTLQDALTLGQGDVVRDAGQLASLGSAVGGVGNALGLSLGGLSGLAGPLGLAGFALAAIDAAFSGQITSDEQAYNEISDLWWTPDRLASAKALIETEPTDAPMHYTHADYDPIEAAFNKYGPTLGNNLEMADTLYRWGGRTDKYLQYMPAEVKNYLAGLKSGADLSSLITDTSTEDDRGYVAGGGYHPPIQFDVGV